MGALVTLKLTVEEFDNLRKAVERARALTHKRYVELREQEADRDVTGAWYDFSIMCKRLGEHTLK